MKRCLIIPGEGPVSIVGHRFWGTSCNPVVSREFRVQGVEIGEIIGSVKRVVLAQARFGKNARLPLEFRRRRV